MELCKQDENLGTILLQYADHMMVFMKVEKGQVAVLKLNLLCFELRLSIDLYKRLLVVLVCNKLIREYMASFLHCKSKKLPIKYLGLPLLDKALLIRICSLLLSLGGILVMLNAVHSTLPIYHVSILILAIWLRTRMDNYKRSCF